MPELFAALQGTWEIEQNVNNAACARQAAIRRVQQQIRIQGTSWAYVYNNNGIETESTKYQMVLDPKAGPRDARPRARTRTSWSSAASAAPAMVEQIAMKGIVKVEGDTLTFCYVYGYQANAERPKQFFAGNQIMPNGTTAMTMTLKRVK